MNENDQPSQSRRIARSSMGVSFLTMISRVLGLLRDKGLVLLFGAAPGVLDAFLFAFTIPNLFRRVFGEGAVSAAFIPAFVQENESKGKNAATTLASASFTLLFLVTAAISFLGILICLGLVSFVNSDWQKVMELLVILLPFLPLVCCAALLSAVLQGVRRFLLPAAMSILLNLALIISFAVILWTHPLGLPANTPFWQVLTAIPAHIQNDAPSLIRWAAWSVLFSGVAQIAVQWGFLAMNGIRIFPLFSFKTEVMRSALKSLGPIALGLGVVQLNVFIDNLIAYWLSSGRAPGATTYLYLGNRLMQLPLGVFGIALATTAFPYLASHAAKGDWKELLQSLTGSFRMLFFVVLPASAGLIVMADPLIRMLYQEPDLTFSHAAVYRSSATLALYSAGLIFFCMQQLLTRVFYARKDYMTPVKISVGMVALNLVMNLTLIHMPDLYRRWGRVSIPGISDQMPLNEAGLALSTTLSAAIGVYLLWTILKKTLVQSMGENEFTTQMAPIYGALARIGIGSLLMGVFVYFVRNSIPWEPELWMRIYRGLTPVAVGFAAYILLCWVIPIPELGEFFLSRQKRKKDTFNTP